jgi:hypothetical protein
VSRVLLYIARFAVILIGYVAAALAASAFLHLLLLGSAGFPPDEVHAVVMGSLFFSIPFTALFVGYFAFLPSAAAILIGEISGQRSWLFHALAGASVGLAVFALFWQSAIWPDSGYQAGLDSAYSTSQFVGMIIGSGIVGGLAYWLCAGRWAGNWRSAGEPDSSISSGPSGS